MRRSALFPVVLASLSAVLRRGDAAGVTRLGSRHDTAAWECRCVGRGGMGLAASSREAYRRYSTDGIDQRPPSPRDARDRATGILIAAVASLATALVIVTWHGSLAAAKAHPVDFAVFFVLTAALMLLAVDIYGKGSISVAGVTLLATGFTFGIGAGVLAGIFAAPSTRSGAARSRTRRSSTPPRSRSRRGSARRSTSTSPTRPRRSSTCCPPARAVPRTGSSTSAC